MYRLVHVGRGPWAGLAGGQDVLVDVSRCPVHGAKSIACMDIDPVHARLAWRSKGCVETFAPSLRTDDPGRYKVICPMAGSFGDAQRQGAGIGALTSGPAFGGRTKVA
jgi:hypothetical protein